LVVAIFADVVVVVIAADAISVVVDDASAAEVTAETVVTVEHVVTVPTVVIVPESVTTCKLVPTACEMLFTVFAKGAWVNLVNAWIDPPVIVVAILSLIYLAVIAK
jgi:hypothetical protein